MVQECILESNFLCASFASVERQTTYRNVVENNRLKFGIDGSLKLNVRDLCNSLTDFRTSSIIKELQKNVVALHNDV